MKTNNCDGEFKNTIAMMVTLSVFFLLTLVGYFVGSIPSGFLLAKIRGKDLRNEGSGNIGATNATRVLGKKAGITVFFLDFAKGYLCAVVFQKIIMAVVLESADLPITFLLSIWFFILFVPFFGHVFSIFLGFRGGKGVATLSGVVVYCYPLVFVVLLAVFLVLYFSFRIISLASLAVSIAMPFLHAGYMALVWPSGFAVFHDVSHSIRLSGLVRGNLEVFAIALQKTQLASEFSSQIFFIFSVVLLTFISLLVVYFHRSNIRRLLEGKELAFKK